MRTRNIAIYLFVLWVAFSLTFATAQERPREITAQITNEYNRPVQLQIEISCDKSEVSLKDLIAFDVKLFNLPVDEKREDISIFNPLKLGSAGGLTITIVSPKGNEVFPKELRSQVIQPVIDDTWPYFTLLTYHYLGAIYKDTARNIFQNKGKYFVYAEYLSPVTTEAIKKQEDTYWNFWGREIGPIRSAPLEITVTE